jgi:Calx-beta domain/Dickkopf N-terminal cysteine-rich region
MKSTIAQGCAAVALGLAVFVLGPTQARGSCSTDADCIPGNSCSGGVCVLTLGCSVDTQCPQGQFCTSGFCATPTPTSQVCSTSADCPPGLFCGGGICATPTPTIFITFTPTPTPTFTPTAVPTPTPTSIPSITIDDVVALERTSFLTTFFNFTVTLSQPLKQSVSVSYATGGGTATAGSDYFARSGTLTFSPGVTTLQLSVGVVADKLSERNETFFVKLGKASAGVLIADAEGEGVIVNDDFVFRIGTAELAPPESSVHVGEHLPVTLTWTHPVRWRDLDTVDLRLRDENGIAIWLRFDEAANTFALVDPTYQLSGAGSTPGEPGQLAGELVAVRLDESAVQADGPDAPSVDLTFALSFALRAAGKTYTVEAAATDDSGGAQDFEALGTIAVLPAAPTSCPGDCDGNGTVLINELLLGVDIALDAASLDLCPSFDADGNGTVDVTDIIAAVHAALTGCPVAAVAAGGGAHHAVL